MVAFQMVVDEQVRAVQSQTVSVTAILPIPKVGTGRCSVISPKGLSLCPNPKSSMASLGIEGSCFMASLRSMLP